VALVIRLKIGERILSDNNRAQLIANREYEIVSIEDEADGEQALIGVKDLVTGEELDKGLPSYFAWRFSGADIVV
jgi:hypothetical protein